MWAVDDAPVPVRPAGYVEALLEERRGYVARGLDERVAQVDAEIARYGVAVADVHDGITEPDPVETAEAEPAADIETPEVKPSRRKA